MKNAEEKAREFTEDLARTLKSLVGLAMSIEECQTFVNAVVNETMNEYAIDKATELLEKEREQIEEYANQQPKVDIAKSKKLLDSIEFSEPRFNEETNRVERDIVMKQSTLTQDNLREAAEKVYKAHENLETSLLVTGDEPDLLTFKLAMKLLGVELEEALTQNK